MLFGGRARGAHAGRASAGDRRRARDRLLRAEPVEAAAADAGAHLHASRSARRRRRTPPPNASTTSMRAINGIDAVTGLPYDALDPDLLLYVHACLVESALLFERSRSASSTTAGRQRFHEEQMLAAEMVRIPREVDPAHRARAPGVPRGRVRLGPTRGSARPRSGWPSCSTTRRARPSGGRCWSACRSWRSAPCRRALREPVRGRGRTRPPGGVARGVRGDPGAPAAPAAAASGSSRRTRSGAPGARSVSRDARRSAGVRVDGGSQPARRDAERPPLDSARGRDRGRPARHRRRARRVVGAAAGRDRNRRLAAFERGMPFRLITNTTTQHARRPRDHARATRGSTSETTSIITAVAATAQYLRAHHPNARCFVLSRRRRDARTWRASSSPTSTTPRSSCSAARPRTSPTPTMNRIFGRLMDGAALVGMHRNLYWRTERRARARRRRLHRRARGGRRARGRDLREAVGGLLRRGARDARRRRPSARPWSATTS